VSQTGRVAVSTKNNSDAEWQVKLSYIAGAVTEGTSVTEHVKILDKSPPVPAAGNKRHGDWSSHIRRMPDQFNLLTSDCFRVPDLMVLYMYWITLSSGLLIEFL